MLIFQNKEKTYEDGHIGTISRVVSPLLKIQGETHTFLLPVHSQTTTTKPPCRNLWLNKSTLLFGVPSSCRMLRQSNKVEKTASLEVEKKRQSILRQHLKPLKKI